LNALAAEQARATFFVVGSRVEKEPNLIKRMIAEGHEVGNHTMTHRRLDALSPMEVRQEMIQCANAIRHAAGRDVTLFRPPGMRSNSQVLGVATSLGYTTIDWTTGAKDFTGSNGNGEQVEPSPKLIADRVLSNAFNGSIILLHDTPATAKAMPAIIRGLRARSFQIVSVSQMLASLPQPVFVSANPLTRLVYASNPPAKQLARSKPKRSQNLTRRHKKRNAPRPDKRQLLEYGIEEYSHVYPVEVLQA
jgi:peptidoglycan/xylan/chitin deacetylase (PgdA/CDA1 family)